MKKKMIHTNEKKEEHFPLVNEKGETIGKATRKECHNGTKQLHPVVHLHIFNESGELYLQKRAMSKDIQPGKWDTSVGGHVDYGETTEAALKRETSEELGITDFEPVKLTSYIFESEIEREMVNAYKTTYQEIIQPNEGEISEGKFWTIKEIFENLDNKIFTPNFEHEFRNILLPLIFKL